MGHSTVVEFLFLKRDIWRLMINVKQTELEENEYLFIDGLGSEESSSKKSPSSIEKDPLRYPESVKGQGSQIWTINFYTVLAILSSIFLVILMSIVTVLFFLISWVLGLLACVSILSCFGFLFIVFFIGFFCLGLRKVTMIIEVFFSGILAYMCSLVVEITIVGMVFIILWSTNVITLADGIKFNTDLFPTWGMLIFEFVHAFVIESLTEETAKYFVIFRIKHRLKSPQEYSFYSMIAATGFVLIEDLIFCLTRYLLFLDTLSVSSHSAELFWVVTLLSLRVFLFYPLSIFTAGIIGLKLFQFQKILLFPVVIGDVFVLHGLYQTSIMFGVIIYRMNAEPVYCFIGLFIAVLFLGLTFCYDSILSGFFFVKYSIMKSYRYRKEEKQSNLVDSSYDEPL